MTYYLTTTAELANNNITSNSELSPDKRKTKKKFDKNNNNKNQDYEILENINKICLCLRTKKRNIEKIFFEEAMKLINEKLDIYNLFFNLLRVEIYKEQITINISSFPISKENREYITNLEKQFKEKKTKSKIFKL